MTRSWTRLALLILAAVVAGQLLVRGGGGALSTGRAAPPLALPGLEGVAVDLTALRGKVVAVNFWATWCAPCRRELPELAAFWAANRDRCFELLGVVEESPRDEVVAAARQIPYPVLLDAQARVASAWKVAGYPRTYLLDAEGSVRQVFEGAIDAAALEAAVAPLRPASCPSR
jgi:cytochrome c biogenesis protein CcmG/thiol:disulfide interchange protein DsbE